MTRTSIAEVKAKLSEYIDRALAGERIVICRHNKPIAELRALDEVRAVPRPVGPLPGRPTFEVSASFFEPLSDEELDVWEGGPAAETTPKGRGRQVSRVAESRSSYSASRAAGKGARRRR